MKSLAILMLSLSMLAACAGPTEEPEPAAAPEPEPVAAEPAMTHPEIMQMISEERPILQSSIENEDGAAAAEAAMKLQQLFQEAIPIYQQRGLDGAIQIATGAAAAAGEAASAAEAGDFEAAMTAHGNVAVCQSCHQQFREKTPDGSAWQFKAME